MFGGWVRGGVSRTSSHEHVHPCRKLAREDPGCQATIYARPSSSDTKPNRNHSTMPVAAADRCTETRGPMAFFPKSYGNRRR
jgi:hypothetical protein